MSKYLDNDSDDSPPDHLQILTLTETTGRRQVTEYLDTSTGEILAAQQVRKLGVKEIRPDARERREATLDALRKEVRQFALFVLPFRNGRCSFSPGMDQLVKWYAFLHDRRPCDVRRLVKGLESGGIIERSAHGEHVPTLDFRWNRSGTTRESIDGEYAASTVKLDRLLIARRYAAGKQREREAA